MDESAHHALANAGGREIVGKKEGEQKGSARGSVYWGCYYATALGVESVEDTKLSTNKQHSLTLRLIRNAAALAAASPTLLFRPL